MNNPYPGWWYSIEQLLGECKLETPEAAVLEQDSGLEQNGLRTAMILFGSSRPRLGRRRGCPLSARNLLSISANVAGFRNVSKRVLVHSATCTMLNVAMSITTWNVGGQVILPSPSFSPEASLEAIERCKAQMMVIMAPQVRQVTEHPSFWNRDLSSICRVVIGDVATLADLCETQSSFLRARVDTAYGLTEGAGLLGWRYRPFNNDVPDYHGIVPVGVATHGALVRICGEDGKILHRYGIGELHLGGPALINRYLHDEEPEAFYTEPDSSWFRTGDRAFMDNNGLIYILGKIKDTIKRNGVSLSPALVEARLRKECREMDVSVLGVPHSEFGEVPIAVTKQELDSNRLADLRKLVSDKLGPDYALEDVVTLSTLGLDSFPIYQTGKVMKFILRQKYLERREILARKCLDFK
jgi:acyl-CoA synthetase (AMP-forming)/AMP-acid ligase II